MYPKKEYTMQNDANCRQNIENYGSDSIEESTHVDGERQRKGYSFFMASFFMVAQMAGAGFLYLPKAISNTGWSGMLFLTFFCICVCFTATKIGEAWIILEERWPEYRQSCRQPYMEIVERAIGKSGRIIILGCMMFSIFGASVIFIILISQFIGAIVPQLSNCQWIPIAAACIMPFTWLGTPKDFWQAPIITVISTVLCIVVIIVSTVLELTPVISENPPEYATPTIVSYSLAYGAILFAFGGIHIFPTIQNDMKDRTSFKNGAILAFATLYVLYAPVAAVGYYYFGSDVHSNVLLSLKSNVFVTIAIIFELINLLGTYLIAMSPLSQLIEDVLHIPREFNWRRVVLRSTLVLGEATIAMAVPDFGLIINLIGGFPVAISGFIFPLMSYKRLIEDKSNKQWPERNISMWENIFMWLIMVIGIIGSISGTVSAFLTFFNVEHFQNSCFVQFGKPENISVVSAER